MYVNDVRAFVFFFFPDLGKKQTQITYRMHLVRWRHNHCLAPQTDSAEMGDMDSIDSHGSLTFENMPRLSATHKAIK